MITAYAILVLCNVVPEASSYISQEKPQVIQGMLLEEHLVTLYICVYQVFHVEKNINLSAARHSTQQLVKLLVEHYLKK